MKNNMDLLNKHTDPFSDKAKQISLEFDTATLSKDVDTLMDLLDNAEKSLDAENNASKAMIYYSLGTAYDDLSRLTGSQTEEAFQKVLYCFRKSINLIEQDEYTKDIYRPYILGFKEILYTNYANALDHCGRKIAAIDQYKKMLSFHNDFGMALGNLGRIYQHYGMLEYDNEHRDLFHYFAYHYLNKSTK